MKLTSTLVLLLGPLLVDAQTVKVYIYQTKDSNSSLTVKTTGSLSNLTGLELVESSIKYEEDANALALGGSDIGLIGDDSVDVYYVPEQLTTSIDVEFCGAHFGSRRPDVFELGPGSNSSETHAVYLWEHKNDWYLILPAGYKAGESLEGHSEIELDVELDDNNNKFGNITEDSCSLEWNSGDGNTTQMVQVLFQEPPTVAGAEIDGPTTNGSRDQSESKAEDSSVGRSLIPMTFGVLSVAALLLF